MFGVDSVNKLALLYCCMPLRVPYASKRNLRNLIESSRKLSPLRKFTANESG